MTERNPAMDSNAAPANASARHLPWRNWPPTLWRALLTLWLLFWAVMIFVAVQDNWGDDGIRWWQPLVWEGSSAIVGTLFTYVMLGYGARQQHLLGTPWRWFWQHIKWLPIVSALFIALAFGMRHGIYTLLGTTYTHASWLQVYVYETAKLALFLGLWLGVIFGVYSFLAWREQQQRLHVVQQALTEAKLQQLKAQLQPHFLFNTLNTISAFMHSDVARADRLLIQLADLLRASLTFGERDTVALADELHLLRLYADIMTERFAPRVQIDWQIDPASETQQIPTLLLQPLLENAFKHGVERAAAVTHIIIRSQLIDQRLQVCLSNTRAQIAGLSHTSSAGTGVGLRNCRERLQAIYGEAASLTLQDAADHFDVIVNLPAVSTGARV